MPARLQNIRPSPPALSRRLFPASDIREYFFKNPVLVAAFAINGAVADTRPPYFVSMGRHSRGGWRG